MENIANLESEIRNLINQPRKKHFLLMDSAQWYQLCSSMDVIGDTELAIDAYLESSEKPATTGNLYILLYGILQVLFVQQDAVKNLAESLNLKFESNKKLTAIREIRNNSVGHPTKKEKKKEQEREKWSNFITRISMSRLGFALITTYPDRNSTFKQVDLCQLISEQREALRKILTEVITCLKREAMEHINTYKDEKLVLH